MTNDLKPIADPQPPSAKRSLSEIPYPRRIAVLADIHGNSVALDAVLADIEAKGGVDAHWLLGDYAAIGPDPVGVLERIMVLPQAQFIRGNTDRLAASLNEFDRFTEESQENPEILPVIVQMNRSFAWTAGALTAAGWLPWMADLPLDMRVTLPDGTRVLAVHSSPGTDDGTGIHPKLADEELGRLIDGAEADLICIGHTHAPLDRVVNGIRVVNPGSIGNPVLPGAGAFYAMLECGLDGYDMTLEQVTYDKEAVVVATRSVRHPAASYIESFLAGRRVPDWARND
ncbi:MAG TPA: metallophosphoesterase family protein [Anaerolineae bacterium]|jgi:predicted phosphodiesterase|nr:metallophosphoesterase family protein [Anaerolineae bacterium]